MPLKYILSINLYEKIAIRIHIEVTKIILRVTKSSVKFFVIK